MLKIVSNIKKIYQSIKILFATMQDLYVVWA